MAELCGVPFVAAELRTGQQRRAFLTDPTHKHVFHFTPTHGSWLNQVELWFSVLTRRFLKRGDFAFDGGFRGAAARLPRGLQPVSCPSLPLDLHGTPLVRGIPFSQTRRQQQQGRCLVQPTAATVPARSLPPKALQSATQENWLGTYETDI